MSSYKYLIMQRRKRFRSVNFSATEKDLLFSVLENYKDVIEKKGCDSATLTEKEIAWNNITDEFNLLSKTNRSIQTLKTCWGNTKKRNRSLFEPDYLKEELRRKCILKKQQAEKINSILLTASSCELTSNPKVITLRVQAGSKTDTTTSSPTKTQIIREASRTTLCKPLSPEKLCRERKELASHELYDPSEEDKHEDGRKLNIEVKKLDLEAKRLEIETKKCDVEAKKLDLEEKRLEVEAKRCDIEAKKIDLEAKKIDLEDKRLEVEAKRCDIEAKKLELKKEV